MTGTPFGKAQRVARVSSSSNLFLPAYAVTSFPGFRPCLVLPTDVAYPDQVEAAAATVESWFGPIDVWVNNAMASVLSPAMKLTADEYQRVTNVTYLGYVYGTLAALRRMVPRECVVL